MTENPVPTAEPGQGKKKIPRRSGTVGRLVDPEDKRTWVHSPSQGQNKRLACPVAGKHTQDQKSQGVDNLGVANRSPKLHPGGVDPRGKQSTEDLSAQSYERR